MAPKLPICTSAPGFAFFMEESWSPGPRSFLSPVVDPIFPPSQVFPLKDLPRVFLPPF